MAAMSNPSAPPQRRIAQLRQAYRITKQHDRNLGLILLLWFLVVGGLFATAAYFLLGRGVLAIIFAVVFGLLSGVLTVLIVFGRRAERAAYAQLEGQPGAAAGAMQMLRRGYDLKPAVAVSKNQDAVHRVVGRSGVVLVGEGNSGRVKGLLAAERKRHVRTVGESVPVLEIVVGDGEGEVPITKLVNHVRKLPKAIKPTEQTLVMNKLRALDAMRPPLPMPKGPMPTSMKGARRAMRG